MSRQSSTVPLKHHQLGIVGGFLFDGISDGNLRDYADYWKPWFEVRREEIVASRRPGEAIGPLLEDFHWDWQSLAKTVVEQRSAETPDAQMFCIEHRGHLQGLMLLEHTGHTSRIAAPRPASYVALLSTAPWNRAWFRWGKLYSAVGTLLIRQAIAENVARGYGGRVGLHSLPGSESFYRSALGMREFDLDPEKEKLRYFEFDPPVAESLLRGGR